MTGINCYMFVPGVLVGLENLLPLLARLAAEDWKIRVVVTDDFMERTIDGLPDYLEFLHRRSEVIRIGYDSRGGIGSKGAAFLKFLSVLVRMAFTPELRVITFQSVNGVFGRTLSYFARIKKCRYYFVSKLHAPVTTMSFATMFDAMKNECDRKFIGKRTSAEKKHEYLGVHLMHSLNVAECANLVGYPKDRIIIGYPKMMTVWREYLLHCKPTWDKPELAAVNEIITVLLKEPHLFFFRKGDSTDVFLVEIITAIRRYFPEILIVLKAKPRPHRAVPYSYKWALDVAEHMGESHVILSDMPTSYLAKKSRAAFAVGETSALFDFLLAGVPALEHSRYCAEWLRIYPYGSFWREIGVTITESPGELDGAVRRIAERTFPVPDLEHWRGVLGHIENPSVFTNL